MLTAKRPFVYGPVLKLLEELIGDGTVATRRSAGVPYFHAVRDRGSA